MSKGAKRDRFNDALLAWCILMTVVIIALVAFE